MTELETLNEWRSFGGQQRVLRHASESLGCSMECAVYLPPQATHGPVPVLWWLSGLTCSWENFTTKAGVQAHAAQHGLAVVAPDTSPRGLGLPGEDDSFDLGSGAGFYVDASEPPWAPHYRMYSYVTDELPTLLAAQLPLDLERQGVAGHSMGGHGALLLALRNPERFRSVSAFAPICAPTHCPWGERAFQAYLGNERAKWCAWDACELIAQSRWRAPILVDQGEADPFLEEQLHPERLQAACEQAGVPLHLRMRKGYDHSYYFIASFLAAHVAHHARALCT